MVESDLELAQREQRAGGRIEQPAFTC
jgi:hypothetical protein